MRRGALLRAAVACVVCCGWAAAGGWLGGGGWAGLAAAAPAAGGRAGAGRRALRRRFRRDRALVPAAQAGACGVGASGTAAAAGPERLKPEPVPTPRSAASAMALHRTFTAISSSLKTCPRTPPSRARSAAMRKPHLTEYQTHQSAQVASPARERIRGMLSLEVAFSSN